MAHGKPARIPEEKLAEYWFTFMHRLLEELQVAYRRAHVKEGLTQKDIAALLGRDSAFISRCLRGQQNMTVRTISNIARAMDCRLNVSLESLNQLAAAKKQISQTIFPEDIVVIYSGNTRILETGQNKAPVSTDINLNNIAHVKLEGVAIT